MRSGTDAGIVTEDIMRRVHREAWRFAAVVVFGAALAVIVGAGSVKAQTCPGDCNDDAMVLVNELIICVNIALDSLPVSACPACDVDGDGKVVINELIAAVNVALRGSCRGGSPTATATQGEEPPTHTATQGEPPTPTATPQTGGTPCPLAAGRYTITQGAGGLLRVGTFAEFPFPQGGTLVQEVSPAFEPACIHSVVVPFPGGFNAPTFCIPALGFTTSVTQTGCGVGRIDSNGGSDFTVLELGDTSDTNGPCNLPQSSCTNMASDSSIHVNIQVGDGTPDTCPGGGTGNALVVVPVFTKTWLEVDEAPPGDGKCPGDNFNENADQLIVEFPQNLDFTTDRTQARFEDLDGDGCRISGQGPAVGLPARTGVCMDLNAKTVTTVAAGVVGSSGGPTYDLAFSTILPNTFNDPEPLTGITCADPPAINFEGDGRADRCIMAQ